MFVLETKNEALLETNSHFKFWRKAHYEVTQVRLEERKAEYKSYSKNSAEKHMIDEVEK